jgi:hypothetical protein
VETNQELIVVTQVPCTTGLFGPTHMASLVKDGELIIEGSLFDPQPDDMYGCSMATRSSKAAEWEQDGDKAAAGESCQNRIIQAVHRGECSFIGSDILVSSSTG